MDAQIPISQLSPPPIPIPPRQAHSQHAPSVHGSATSRSRRRSNPSSTHPRPRKRPDKDSAAPEVISNILDSLAMISAPPSPAFDSSFTTPRSGHFPSNVSSPTSPTVRTMKSQGSGHRSMHHQYAAEFVAFQQSLQEENRSGGDAAEPPVIRSGKRRGEEALAGTGQKKDHVAKAYYVASPPTQSVIALAQPTWGEDARLTSGEPTDSNFHGVIAPRRSSLGLGRGGLGISNGANRSAVKVASREKILKTDTFGYEDVMQDAMRMTAQTRRLSPRRKSPATSPLIGADIETPVKRLSPRIPASVVSNTPQSVKEGKRPLTDAASGTANLRSPIGPAVPSRNSSLHPDKSPRMSSPKIPSPKIASPSMKTEAITPPRAPSKHSSHFIEALPEADELSVRPIATARQLSHESVNEINSPKISSGLGAPEVGEVDAETDVQRRIRELKAQKEARDRLARQIPSTMPTASFPMPPFTIAAPSTMSTNRLDRVVTPDTMATGARKTIRPIPINVPPPGPLLRRVTPERHASQNLEVSGGAKDLDDSPGTPLTPMALPIDYNHVVTSMNRISPPKDRPTTSASGRSRSYLFNKRSSSTSLSLENSPFGKRRSSDGPPGTHLLRRSSSIKGGKRWSSSDFGLGLERKGSVRSDSYAVKPAIQPSPLAEERCDSLDEIDAAVSLFVRSQRLSQKIIDPQTGRVISFSEVGDPKGHAVFCCVGMGLTRYVTAFYDELAATLKLRLITPDRPGVGDSQTDPLGTPLSWPDDITAICHALSITKFSLLAHSAGAIYALATALRMPQTVRGRVHLLAPWIPPSQLSTVPSAGQTTTDNPPEAQLPRSQRILRVLPAPFLKVANSAFLSATSASLSPSNTTSRPKPKKRGSHPSTNSMPRNDSPSAPRRSASESIVPPGSRNGAPRPVHIRRESMMLMDQQSVPNKSTISLARSSAANLRAQAQQQSMSPHLSPVDYDFSNNLIENDSLSHEEDQRTLYDESLTLRIWSLATLHANPAVDLLVCLERNQPIGFRYVDITRSVVIHHGSKDTRVPVENVKWLGKRMRRCEVRVLESEGHGLMASAAVMGGVLREMSREWEDWERAVRGNGAGVRTRS